MKILVTGGSGMVGKFLKRKLPNAIYLSSNDCDLTKYDEVFYSWKIHKPDVVIHLAARVGGILDNINYPAEYLEQNVLINTNVLNMSRKFNVGRFIGLLSTCIYPDFVDEYPMTEEMLHNGAPTATNIYYGYAKRLMALHIDAYNKQYGLNYQYLIPCNLYVKTDDKFKRPEELNYLRGDATKIKNVLGWKPKYTFEEMIDEMILYWMMELK